MQRQKPVGKIHAAPLKLYRITIRETKNPCFLEKARVE
jgi:hypothetical protein